MADTRAPSARQMDAGRNGRSRGLADDALTVGVSARSLRSYLREALDRLAGADPGLTQLRTAVQAVLGIALAVVGVYAFVRLTGALQLPAGAGPPATVAAENHALLIVSMLMAGIVAMMASFAVTDTSVGAIVLSTALLPLPMLATITAGIALGPYRVPSLVFLVCVLSGAVYVRRYGQRGIAAGLVAFQGGFLGFFLHAEIQLSDLGWLAADIAIGAAASLVVRLTLLRPDTARTLARMRRSWGARARRLLALSIDALHVAPPQHLDAAGDAARWQTARRERVYEQLRRQLVRLNESTLMIDAQVAETVPQRAAYDAQVLFDAELALSNIARFSQALGGVEGAAEIRALADTALSVVLAQDEAALPAAIEALRSTPTGSTRANVLSRRLAASIEAFAQARRDLDQAIADRLAGRAPMAFTPAVELRNGFLPGSGPVSEAASTTVGRGGVLDRAALPPYVRGTIQMAVAATLAVVVGDIVSGYRLYWALLATFLAFMATTNSGEQVRKALFRVGGTAFGIVIGDVLVRLTHGDLWSSVAIVLVALFFGIYTIRVNYTFMVIAVTVTMSQLYYQLGEFSWSLLVLRLGETAVGVGAVVVTVLLIVPLRPQRVLITGTSLWFQAVSGLLDTVLDRLLGSGTGSLRPAVRDADAAWAALEATAAPLRGATFGRNLAQLREIRSVSAAARNYARSLANNVERAEPGPYPQLRDAARQLRASVAAIGDRIEAGEHGAYVRSASLIELAREQIGPCDWHLGLAMRDLTLLDGALARLAQALDMDVHDLDTQEAGRS